MNAYNWVYIKYLEIHCDPSSTKNFLVTFLTKKSNQKNRKPRRLIPLKRDRNKIQEDRCSIDSDPINWQYLKRNNDPSLYFLLSLPGLAFLRECKKKHEALKNTKTDRKVTRLTLSGFLDEKNAAPQLRGKNWLACLPAGRLRTCEEIRQFLAFF